MTSRGDQSQYFAWMRYRILRRLAKLTPIALGLVFIGMQFVPAPGVARTSTTAPHPAEMINPQIGRILNRSCQDCHSNRTAWPWYSRVAPLSWVIAKHVIEGREVLDFSKWATQPPDEGDRMLICDAVSGGRMPLREYTAIHRKAKLSKQDVKSICDWADATGTPITSTHIDRFKNKEK